MGTKRYTFEENKITAQAVDQANNLIWLAFLQDGSGNCALQNSSAFSPNQLYYDIDKSVDEIKKMVVSGSYLYLLYEDSALIGGRYYLTSPLTSSSDFSLPGGITETPVDMLVSGSNLWYLTPGSASGENAKLVRMSLSGTLYEIVDLIESGNVVTDAISFTEDSVSGDLYIVTNTSPTNLVRVYQNTGGSYEFDVTIGTANYPSKVISHNPLAVVTNESPAKLYTVNVASPSTPVWTAYTLTGATYAKDIVYNSDTGYYYVACADGIMVKVEVATPTNQTIFDVSDTDDLLTIDALDEYTLTFASTENAVGELYQIDERTSEVLNTNFYYNLGAYVPMETNFNWIEIKSLDTDFQYLENVNTKLQTDFKWLPAVGTFTPIGREDINITVNGTPLSAGDLILDSVDVTHTIDSESIAIFNVARNHDNINQTLAGGSSELTNQNAVVITINGITEFTGKVATLDCQYTDNNEYIVVTAKSAQPAFSTQLIAVSLPSTDEDINIYDVLVQNPVINNPYIDPNIDTETETVEYYKGVKVSLGQKITQQQFRGRYIESTGFQGNFQGRNAGRIDDGTFNYKNDYTYFWLVEALNYVSAVAWGSPTYKYIGTSLSSVSADTWYLKGVAYWAQRIMDDKVQELGDYEVGSAPFKEISTKNGQLITKRRYEDRADGLYSVQDESYNYIDYAKEVADLEYEKLQNINGDILPITSVSMQLSFDAYHYYNMKLLNRINVDNTTSAGIFYNSNGFPVSIKSININSKLMRVSLKTDNTKSKTELDEIDDRYPDEDDYVTPAYPQEGIVTATGAPQGRITQKWKLPSSQRSTAGASYNFLPPKFWDTK